MRTVPPRLVSTAIWAFAVVGSLLFASGTHFGPIILVLGNAHGLHLGDLVAIAGLTLWAWSVTRTFSREPSR